MGVDLLPRLWIRMGANHRVTSTWAAKPLRLTSALITRLDLPVLAEALIGEPDAITAEAFQPLAPQPSAPLEEKDEAAILAWLGRIGETDEDTLLDVLDSCRTNAEARKFFISRALQP